MTKIEHDLTIFVPVYNEEATLPSLLKKLERVKLKGKTQLIIVNDGSTDKSQKIISKWSRNKSLPFSIKLIEHSKNKGKGSGIQTALRHATGQYFVTQDADLEYNPAEIPRLLKVAFKTKTPVVYGSRFLGSIRDMPTPNYYANRFYNLLVRALYGVKITDMHTCYKMIETKLYKDIRIQSHGFGYAPEVVSKLLRKKVPIVEVPISYNGRSVKEGKKISARDGWECLAHLLKYRFKDERDLFAVKQDS